MKIAERLAQLKSYDVKIEAELPNKYSFIAISPLEDGFEVVLPVDEEEVEMSGIAPYIRVDPKATSSGPYRLLMDHGGKNFLDRRLEEGEEYHDDDGTFIYIDAEEHVLVDRKEQVAYRFLMPRLS